MLSLKDSKDLKWQKIRSQNKVSCIQNIVSSKLKFLSKWSNYSKKKKERGVPLRALKLILSSSQAIDL